VSSRSANVAITARAKVSAATAASCGSDLGLKACGDTDPVRERAVASHRSDRLSGFENEERCVHGGSVAKNDFA